METAVDLLADPAPEARAAAVRALAGSGSPAAPLLLRLKARLGDARAEVTGECLTALLWLDWRSALPLALEHLDGPDTEAAAAAALALGEAKTPEGFGVLRARLPDSPIRPTLLMAIALLRSDEALMFLRELAAARDRDALAALKLYDNPAR
ncbi:MAG: hypothetical protein M1541_11300 [Acidobacteria bacterium]|nr:hypothetical protein [Acidobacteriota bacterium]